ncbi:triose-phosphate isomerase, partial [Candidatus Woesearchaeota archaeon]|nr:triose-phosphate isomerase [Candidatus Woesearchaeota archaeon]
INFKNYPEAVGEKALVLAKQIAQVKSKIFDIAIAPSILDLKEVSSAVKIPVYSQHADFTLGAYTGSIPVESLKALGISGTLLNHSEKKLPFNILKKTVKHCQANTLTVIICASSLSELKTVAQLNPEFIAYEPPELIGKEYSVVSAHPSIITKAVQLIKQKKTRLLCGAGVHSKEDIKMALKLGASGVLIGHTIPKAKDPKKYLNEIMNLNI